MVRWFEENGKNSDVVISSRIRLARNISGYNFSLKLSDKDARKMVDKCLKTFNGINEFKDYVQYDFKDLSEHQKVAMKERHVISNFLLNQNVAAGIVSLNENMSIMLNEEDHIRIQSYMPGMNIEEAYKMADHVDDLIGKKVSYAYDDKYGFLTTCLSNVGTGMRASYMLHLPALAGSERIGGIAAEIGRFGLMLRGIYGEGNKSLGYIYQLSNQVTLGMSEHEIIDNLNNIAEQIINQERSLRKQYITKKRMTALDSAYRSFGVLRYARKISLKDAMILLSELRLAISQGLIKISSDSDYSVYQLMIGIQPSNLCMLSENELSDEEIDIMRAEFIRENLPVIE